MTPAEKLARIRAIVNTEDDGPEGAMGPAWVLGQVREVINGSAVERIRGLVDEATQIALTAVARIAAKGIVDDEESAEARAEIAAIRRKAGLL